MDILRTLCFLSDGNKIVEHVLTNGRSRQISGGIVGKSQLGGALRRSQAVLKRDLKARIVIYIARPCNLTIGQDNIFLYIPIIIRPGHSGCYQRVGLFRGDPLVCIGRPFILFRYIIDDERVDGQTALGNGEGHGPGNGDGTPILGYRSAAGALGNVARAGYGDICRNNNILAVQGQFCFVMDRFVLPFLGRTCEIGNDVLVGIDPGISNLVEDDTGHFPVCIRIDCVHARIRRDNVPTSVLDHNVTGSQLSQHAVGEFRGGNIFMILVDGDCPIDAIFPPIVVAFFAQLCLLQRDRGGCRDLRSGFSLAGRKGGRVGHRGHRGTAFLICWDICGIGDGIALGILSVCYSVESNARDLVIAIPGKGTTCLRLNGKRIFIQRSEHSIRQRGTRNIQIAGIYSDDPVQLVRFGVMGTGLVKLNAIDRYRGRGILFIAGRVRVRVQGCLIVHRGAIPCLCHRGVVGNDVGVFINAIFVLGKGNICYFAVSIPVDLCASTGLNGHSLSICHAKHIVGELRLNKVLLVAVHCDRPLDIARLVRSNRAALIDSIAEILADGNGLFSAVFHSLTLTRIRGTHADRIIGGNRGLRLIRNGVGVGNAIGVGINTRRAASVGRLRRIQSSQGYAQASIRVGL